MKSLCGLDRRRKVKIADAQTMFLAMAMADSSKR